jgi:hypothetical protein
MHSTTTVLCDILDTHRLTTSQTGADLYMAAYAHIYGCDAAPYWGEETAAEGVELTQAAERH